MDWLLCQAKILHRNRNLEILEQNWLVCWLTSWFGETEKHPLMKWYLPKLAKQMMTKITVILPEIDLLRN